jgi:pimeloyl-ACP methyl ester carboxylesterase
MVTLSHVSEDVVPFRADVGDEVLTDLRDRLRRTRWPDAETVSDWSQGVPLSYLKDLVRHWADSYDWRARQAVLDALPQFRATIDGLGIHFAHVTSPEPTALPLLLTHGWPGSFVEFTEVIGPLTDPAAHGGDPADAFHVVIPSLPGYGWSDHPTEAGWGIERIAEAWAELMRRLGYARYGAQGGDWGAAVTTCLGAQDSEHVAGVHLNLIRGFPPRDQTEFSEAEQAAIATGLHYQEWEAGYSLQQTTRPQTLGYGLADSPVGQCAWILEKFWSWSDCDGDPVAAFGADRLLDNITLYWLSNSAASSARLYWESFRARRSRQIEVPVGLSMFPKEILQVPRHWAERSYPTMTYWNEPERGGHFAAFEQPAIFTDEVRAFFRLVR